MTTQRDNLKAGIFVLVAVVLVLIVVFTLTDFSRLLQKSQQVKVSYRLSDGLKGLKVGAAVTLGDTPVGHVTKIEIETEQGTGRVVGQIVTLELPSEIPMYHNAVIELVAPPLGSGTRIDIANIGMGHLYEPGIVIEGSIARSTLVQDLVSEVGIGDKQRLELQKTITNIEALTSTLRTDVPELAEDLKAVVAEAKTALGEAKAALADLRASAKNIKELTAEINDRRTAWFDRIDNITAAGDEMVGDLRDLVAEKDPALRRTIDNVADITDQVRHTTLGQVHDALGGATEAIANVKKALSEAEAFVVGQRPVLERAIANAQLTTDQLKLAAIEIRRSPWRLLYRPGDEELETDNLYDAARSFALAAGTLDATARSLESVAAKGGPDEAAVRRRLDELEKIFAKFEQAEREFWDALKGKTPVTPP